MHAGAGNDAHSCSAYRPPAMPGHSRPCPAIPSEKWRRRIRVFRGLAHRVGSLVAFRNAFHCVYTQPVHAPCPIRNTPKTRATGTTCGCAYPGSRVCGGPGRGHAGRGDVGSGVPLSATFTRLTVIRVVPFLARYGPRNFVFFYCSVSEHVSEYVSE